MVTLEKYLCPIVTFVWHFLFLHLWLVYLYTNHHHCLPYTAVLPISDAYDSMNVEDDAIYLSRYVSHNKLTLDILSDE